jgi:TfoX/Sxy family transcriptional regulator of competence genes
MTLEDRIDAALGPLPTERKRMFGGVCFMLNDNMLLGTFRGGLMVRVAKADHAATVTLPGASPMVMKDRVMEGFILVDEGAVETDTALQGWISKAMACNATLPGKAAKPPRAAKPRR